MSDLSGRTTIVVGASRGLGRGIATAFAEAGARVVAVSRTAAAFPESADGAGTIQPEVADAGDATVAGSLLDRYEPPRPPSASSRGTPRTRQSAPVWTLPSPRCCPGSRR